MNYKRLLYRLDSLNGLKPVILHLSQISEFCSGQVEAEQEMRDILGNPSKYVYTFFTYKKNEQRFEDILVKAYKKQHDERDKKHISDTNYMLCGYQQEEYEINNEERIFTLSWVRVDDSIELTLDNLTDKKSHNKLKDFDINLYLVEDKSTKAEMGNVGPIRKYSPSELEKYGIYN